MRTSQHGAEHGFDQALCHPQSVHLLIHLRGDWHSDRESLVAELLRRTESAQAYARSAAFLKAYPQRVGVVRVQTEGTAPSVIDSVLGERGIELENLAEPGPSDGPSCVQCGREHLSPSQAAMGEEGWTCPSCLRAWRLRSQPQRYAAPFSLTVPSKVVFSVLALLVGLFVVGIGYELGHLHRMNQVIRAQLPQS